MDRPPSLPAAVEKVLARLLDTGARTYVVGGALRDGLLGRTARDFDFIVECDLESAGRVVPEAIRVGAHAPVLLISPEGERPRIEISALRPGARSLTEDLQGRDFTLNAIAFDPREGCYLDPLDGRSDIAARRLRAPDPERAFRDDPIRILRGVRLAAELGFATDEATARAMARESWRLEGAAGERLRDELYRLLELERPSAALQRLRELGALSVLLPELLRQVGVAQNRHHRENVFEHSLRVCDHVSPDPLLRLAALLHDASKPEAKRFNPKSQSFTFYRHDLWAMKHVRRVAERLRLSKRERSRVERLVRHHLLLPERLQTDAALRRMIRRAGNDILPALLELRRSDLASRHPKGRVPPEWQAIEARIRRLGSASDPTPPQIAIGGKDIMREFGIEEGPEVGRWLRRLRRRATEQPGENERERLLVWLRRAREEE